jgi:hypothetical protein
MVTRATQDLFGRNESKIMIDMMIKNADNVVTMKSNIKDREGKELGPKEIFRKICEDNREVFTEIVEIMSLLRELDIRSYKLTGNVEEPIITYYSIS